MKFLKTVCVVKDKKFPIWMQKKIAEALEKNEGKRLTVTIETEKKHRSNPQNSFYYGVVLPLMYSVFRDDWGNDVTKNDVHIYLKGNVGKLYKEVHDGNGEIRQVLLSSSDLSTIAWEQWMEQIRAWAAPFGIQVPAPNEIMYREELAPILPEPVKVPAFLRGNPA